MVDILSKKNGIYIFKQLVLALIIVSGVELLKDFLNVVEPDNNRLEDEFMSNFIFSFFGAIFLSPIIEELVFRLPLKKGDFFIVSLLLSTIFLITSNFMFVKIIISVFVVLVVLYQFYGKSISLRWILFAVSIFAFVIIHFDNFSKNDFENFGLINTIILFLPHFFLGILLVKIRLETRFLNAIIFHSLYNLTILSLALLFDL